MKVVKNILILGGYGRAGKNIAHLLGKYSCYNVKIAGRNIEAANECAFAINDELNIGRISSKKVDVKDKGELVNALKDVDLVVVCLPLDGQLTENLIHAILNSNCKTYLDISPGKEKHRAFQINQQLIDESDKIFVVDAGCEPGMPSVLIRFLKTINSEIRKVKVNVVYRERDMPDASIQDLLSHNEKGLILEDGVWKEAKNSIKKISFPMNFGKLRTVPVWIPELENIHLEAQITDLEYRHAGINGVSNIVSLLWKSLLNYILPVKTGVKLFNWAIKRFTKEPLGGLLIVEGNDGTEKTTIQGYHKDIYVATAIPAAATAILVLKNSADSPGSYFMNEVVNIPEFIAQCGKMGFEIKVQSS
ncbi:MAG: hypothetical protein HUJ25_04490 [Crocinitomicaceae bacterium]|nr:hypothetical protein [Crocinitomicaceae bacterium]